MPHAMRSIEQVKSSLVSLCCLASAALCGCVHTPWLDDSSVSAVSTTPDRLIQKLGPPAKILKKQSLRELPGFAEGYLYYVVNQRGKVEYRLFFFQGRHFVVSMNSVPPPGSWD